MFAGPGPSSQMSHIELGLSEQSVITSSVDLAGAFLTEIAISIWLTALAMTALSVLLLILSF